jgi:hypothetical protein
MAECLQTAGGGHGERREDAGVEVAVVLALHVLGEGIDVVVEDGLRTKDQNPHSQDSRSRIKF